MNWILGLIGWGGAAAIVAALLLGVTVGRNALLIAAAVAASERPVDSTRDRKSCVSRAIGRVMVPPVRMAGNVLRDAYSGMRRWMASSPTLAGLCTMPTKALGWWHDDDQ